MQIYPETYYHLYNRSINKELLFKEEENYLYFLKNYRERFEDQLDTIAYCLMPTHFHFLIYCYKEQENSIPHKIGIWLSSYTKAINKRYNRSGSLFQRHTKAIPVDNDRYLLTLTTYIHQNPIRSKLVNRLEDWPFSSYRDYIGIRCGSLPKMKIVKQFFQNDDDFKAFSEELIQDIDQKYWV